jgi:hypothetical protein
MNRRSKSPIVAFVTDFGLADGYVSEMYAAVLSHCPEARLMDISHLIAPGDVRSGAFVLWRAARQFPAETIFAAVVDPGVGSVRQAVAVRSRGQFFLGPDNGILARVIDWDGIYEVRLVDQAGSEVSNTFHGRDVFAPAAGMLASGTPFNDIGIIGQLTATFPPTKPLFQDDTVTGEVVYIDGYGNIITDLPAGLSGTISFADCDDIRAINNYAAAEPGTPHWLVGSANLVEIAINRDSAARVLQAGIGDRVIMRLT